MRDQLVVAVAAHLLEESNLAPEMLGELHRGAGGEEKLRLKLQQEIGLEVSEVMSLVVDDNERAASILPIRAPLQRLPDGLVGRVLDVRLVN